MYLKLAPAALHISAIVGLLTLAFGLFRFFTQPAGGETLLYIFGGLSSYGLFGALAMIVENIEHSKRNLGS